MNTPPAVPLPSFPALPAPRPRLSSDDRRRQLLSAKRQLANAHANLVGIVVNRAGVDFPVYHTHEDVPVTSRPART